MREPAQSVALSTDEYQRILEHFQRPLAGFVRSLVGNSEEALDIVQDVFVDAWRAMQREAHPFLRGGDDRAVRSWLYHAAYCDAVSILRHRKVIIWESLDTSDPTGVVERDMPARFEEQVIEREALEAALSTLAPADVICLQLGVIEDFTSVEMARILEITPDAVRKRLSRAMRRLRAAYIAREDDADETTKERTRL